MSAPDPTTPVPRTARIIRPPKEIWTTRDPRTGSGTDNGDGDGDQPAAAYHLGRPHPHDDLGAQSMEYAMLAGGGAAAVGIVGWILRSEWFRDAIENLLTGIITNVGGQLTDLFGGGF